jgi:predicted DNA binding CopG/RHH family protein
MSRYVKNELGYENVEFEGRKIIQALRRTKGARKQPTSVALDAKLIKALKAEGEARGVPYQVLMRMFIIEGFRRLKKTA